MKDVDPLVKTKILENFITNVNSDVFALKNIPQEVIAVLLGKYSRSKTSLKETLFEMLLDNRSIDTVSYFLETNNPNTSQRIFSFSEERASDFHNKWVLGYGHSSISEIAVLYFGIENISMYAAKIIQDTRLASFVEKSTRYVNFKEKPNYKCLDSETLSILEKSMNDYQVFHDTAYDFFNTHFSNQDVTKNQIHSLTCDISRYLLPFGAKTSMGMVINARSLTHLLQRMFASDVEEIIILANKLLEEGKKIAPTLLKHSIKEYNRKYSGFVKNLTKEILENSLLRNDFYMSFTGNNYQDSICRYSSSLYDEVCKEISNTPFPREYTGKNKTEHQSIIDYYMENHSEHQSPGRALELFHFNFSICMDIGAWRDMQRHRFLTQFFPNFEFASEEVSMHPLLEEEQFLSLKELFISITKERKNTIPKNSINYPYSLLLGQKIQWNGQMNLREAIYVSERRSKKEGHISYRIIANKIANKIASTFPELEKHIKVDTDLTTVFARKK